MFSAVYLVCFMSQPCTFFVDPNPYPSLEACKEYAQGNIDKHQLRAVKGEAPPHSAEYQCLAWDKA